jgi:sodium-dependent dicarboxylate transporter 2/3/5
MSKKISAVLGPLGYFLILFFFKPEGLSAEGVAVLAATFWIALWWITEVTDISVTALLPIILFPLAGALSLSETTASYGHKYIFLYMGGFFLAIAIEKWNLHRRIALNIISLVGTSISRIVLGFMLATAFMSMWISNTATSVMMLPIGLAIIKQLKDHPSTEENENEIFGKMLMLSIAYSASIGGIATLFGTPPNLVFAGIIKELYNVEITFFKWLTIGLPISLTLLAIAWFYITRVAFKLRIQEFPGGREEILRLKSELGPMKKGEVIVAIIFGLTALMLILRQWLQNYLPLLDDTIIAMVAGIILCVLPSSEREGNILNWKEAVKMPWGVLILFGGGMALALGFSQTGLAVWIGSKFVLLDHLPIVALILVLTISVNFLTEITSNLATTAMLLPILAPIAQSIDVHPFLLMISATIAASCAFMLPVATPPNAVVFGSGILTIPDMTKAGLKLNIISILLIWVFVYFFLEMILGYSLSSFPF